MNQPYYTSKSFWIFAILISAIALIIFSLTSCKKQETTSPHEYDVKAIINVSSYYSYKMGVVKPNGNQSSQTSSIVNPYDFDKVFTFHDAFAGDSVYFTATMNDPGKEFIGDLQVDFITHVRDTSVNNISLGYKLP